MKIFGSDFNVISAFDIVQTALGFLGRSKKSSTADSSSDSKKGTELKAHAFGIGLNDEALFMDAVVLSFAEESDTTVMQEKVQKVMTVFSMLNPMERYKIVRLVGINEQDVTETTPVTVIYTDQKGVDRQKIEKKEKKYAANERGKRLIQLLSRLTPEEAVKFLRVTVLINPIDNPEEHWKTVVPYIRKLLENVKTLQLEKKAVDAMIWYLGATDIADARRKLAEREQAVADLRAQTWYERDLKHRPSLIKTWMILAIFIIVGLMYTFALH